MFVMSLWKLYYSCCRHSKSRKMRHTIFKIVTSLNWNRNQYITMERNIQRIHFSYMTKCFAFINLNAWQVSGCRWQLWIFESFRGFNDTASCHQSSHCDMCTLKETVEIVWLKFWFICLPVNLYVFIDWHKWLID